MRIPSSSPSLPTLAEYSVEARRALFARYAKLPAAKHLTTLVRIGFIVSFCLLATPLLLASHIYMFTFPLGLILWFGMTAYYKSAARSILLHLIASDRAAGEIQS
jgi:hypothetical protein